MLTIMIINIYNKFLDIDLLTIGWLNIIQINVILSCANFKINLNFIQILFWLLNYNDLSSKNHKSPYYISQNLLMDGITNRHFDTIKRNYHCHFVQ